MKSSSEVVFLLNFITPKINEKWSDKKKEKWFQERAFYSFGGNYNVEDYFSNTAKCKEVLGQDYNSENYYSNNIKTVDKEFGDVIPPFNNKKFLNDEELKEVKKIFKNTKSNIWHGIISFDENTTKEKIRTKEEVLRYMNRTFNALFENSHINKDNICLYATMHTNTDNHHIHFSFCEKEPIYLGRDGKKRFAEKGMFKESSIENFLLSSLWYLEDKDKTMSSTRANIIQALRNIKREDPIIKNDKELYEKIIKVSRDIPRTGKVSYASKEMQDFRKDIDVIADKIINDNKELKDLFNEYREEIQLRKVWIEDKIKNNKAVFAQDNKLLKNINFEFENLSDKEMNEFKNMSKEVGVNKIKKLEDDLKTRIGNVIIKTLLKNGNEKVKEEKRIEKNAKRYIFLQETQKKKLITSIKEDLRKAKFEFNKILKFGIKEIKTNFEQDIELIRKQIEIEEMEKKANILAHMEEGKSSKL